MGYTIFENVFKCRVLEGDGSIVKLRKTYKRLFIALIAVIVPITIVKINNSSVFAETVNG